ncbi:MAG: 2TM domain-containing protein [Candidatus Hydrogenedentota bacterium]
MEENEPTYTPDEVTAIVASALRRQRSKDRVPLDDLVEIAAELGVSRGAVEAAAEHLATEHDMEYAREQWCARQKQAFRGHLVSYVIVNAFLIVLDFTISGGAWWYFPFLGWGVGLAFHAYSTFFPSPEQVEEGARQLIKHDILRRELDA